MYMQTRGEKVFSYINHVLLFVICIITLYPLWHVSIASISDPILVFAIRGFYLWPLGKAPLKGLCLVFSNPNIVSGYLNTLFYVVEGTSLSMVVTILGAYVLSRKGPYWNKVVMGLIIFYMYFQGGLIPFFIMVKNM